MEEKLKQDISIGSNLQKLRIRAGFSQEQVVAQLQLQDLPISREILSQMERGCHSIRISVLIALCKIYHARIEEFFEGLI